MQDLIEKLKFEKELKIVQKKEMIEVIGFESKNKYEIQDQNGTVLMYAGESGSGIFDTILRQILGHYRDFNIDVFDKQGTQLFRANHPFKFYFRELSVFDKNQKNFGKLTKEFSLLHKKFVIELANGEKLQMRSPIMSFWTFPILKNDREVASIKKKWSGLMKESFLDADNFTVSFIDPGLSWETKLVILMSALFIDISYFEKKQS